MSIDPSIPLSVKPVQTPDFLEAYSRAQAIKNQQQQGQISRQQIQMQDLQIQQAKQAQQEEQQIRDILNGSGGSLEKALPDIMKVSPTKGLGYAKSIADQRKSDLDRQESEIKLSKARVDYLSQILSGVTDEASYQAMIQMANRAGIPTDNLAPHYDQATVEGYKQKGLTVAEQLNAAHQKTQEDIARAEEDRKKALFPDQQREATAKAKAAEQDAAGTTPITPFQRATLDNKPMDENRALQIKGDPKSTPEQRIQAEGFLKGLAAQKGAEAVATQNAQMSAMGAAAGGNGVQGPGGEEFLKTIPSGDAMVVKKVAEGKINIPAFALRTPYWQNILRLVGQYDPSFDQINYNSRSQTRQHFTSGKESQQVNALNTVIGHMEQLSDAADKLKNTWSPAYNTVANYLTQQVGRPEVNNFETVKKAVVDEATRVWRQSGGTEADIKDRSEQLKAANSPDQLHGAIAQLGHLLQSKMDALQNQYDQGMGTATIKLLTPKAEKSLTKLEDRVSGQTIQKSVDPVLKAYADKYFGGDVKSAQDAIEKQQKR